jgi:spore coat protein A
MSRAATNTARPTSLHRLQLAWGEGTSNAAQNEGAGAPATAGDATWTHRFHPDVLWTTAGGNFVATASATTNVLGTGVYTWSSAAMLADVQAWFADSTQNHGWLIRGDESIAETAKRFDSSERTNVATRPALVVDYTPPGGGSGDTVVVARDAAADNTLYESATGALSNARGQVMVVSRSAGIIHRGLVRFDLSSIPASATITGATLTLHNLQSGTQSTTVSLFRTAAGWGEGTSLATGTEEAGAPATTTDATWLHRFYPGTLWTAAGGDFAATASVQATVGDAGAYAFTSAALVADVQSWIVSPGTNQGWTIRGRESSGGNGLKRFASRENVTAAQRPRLVVSYVAPPPEPTGACALPGGACDTLTAGECAAAGGTYYGNGSTCDDVPLVLTPYVDPLPRPAVAVPVTGIPGGAATYLMPIREVSQQLHRDLPPTRVWGYAGSYPGPTIEATTGVPITVTWWNDLEDSLGVPRTTHYLPVDECLHGPDEAGPTPRVVTHLHGGHVPPESDGYPESTLLPGQQAVYQYPNNQPPGTLWYHDHALGITRLNVMMGLAGYYLLRDVTENALGLPAGEFEIGLAMQDRAFNRNGSLQYPSTWMEHFEGDHMLVNGKVWPYLSVKRGKYRFRMLNGCNSRVLRLALSNGAPFTVIGTDLGLLPAPVVRETLLITPGERYDVVIDFAPFAAGTQIVLANDAPRMFPGDPGDGVIPNVMRFDVVATAGHTAALPAALRPVAPIDPAESVISRDFVLEKGADPCTGSMWMINDLHWDDVTEYPVLGTAEIWRFINDSGISHPMHLHLVQFQVLDRQPFTRVAGEIVPTGPPVPPDSAEAGWKDTAPVAPHEILRVITRFEDYAGLYAYHCHILEHEDHEMMRQFQAIEAPVIAVADTTAPEGNAPGGQMTFRVTLSGGPVQVAVRVAAWTVDATAHAGVDYVATQDTLVFPPGVTTAVFAVPLVSDAEPEPDKRFTVRIASLGLAAPGDTVARGTIANDDGATDVADAPAASFLGTVSPNPFAGEVLVHWGLSGRARVELGVFDVQGRRVRSLASGVHPPGYVSTAWDGRDDRGRAVPNGVYLVRLELERDVFRGTVLRLR